MRLRIEQDDEPMNPRVDWEHLGTMVCWHGRYLLGDERPSCSLVEYMAGVVGLEWEYDGYEEHVGEVERAWDKRCISLPLYLYDHSGVAMNTTGFSCPWDSGRVGVIYVERWRVCKEMGWTRISRGRVKQVEEWLRREVEEYDHYLTGDVWGYIVEGDNGEVIESCWDFFGEEYAQEEGKDALLAYERREEEEKCNEMGRLLRAV